MVNQKKIGLMTRAAICREKEKKRSLYIDRFSRGDYVTSQMIKSGVAYSAAFLTAVILWALYYAEALLVQNMLEDFVRMGKQLLVVYLAVLMIIEVIAFFVFWAKYNQAQEKVKEYQNILKKLLRFYDKEAEKDEKRGERI